MNQGSILLVEDNADDVELALLAFKRNRIENEIVVACDGAEALEYLFCAGAHAKRDPTRQPSLVLLDLNMPKLNGLDVLRRMRSDPRTQLIPVVVLSTSRADHDVAASYACGANSYIPKPLDFETFSEVVRRLGKYWLEMNQAPPVTRPAR